VRSPFDCDPVSGLRGSLFYRAYEPGGRAYRAWRTGVEAGWGRTLFALLKDAAQSLYGRLRPPAIPTEEGSVNRRDTFRHVVGEMKELDDL
jgi:hypothetical protein